MTSAGTHVSQLFSDAVIDGVLIRDVLVDTGSAYSMVSFALYDRLPTRPAINSFENSAPDIVGVGSASADVRGSVVVPLLIAGFEVMHPLLVVSEVPFAMLIGMDVLRPHAASFSVCDSTSLQLSTSVCPVCLERRAETKIAKGACSRVRCRRELNAEVAVVTAARLAVCAVVSVTPCVEPRGDTGALVTATYSIAASADTSAAATSATTAAQSAICVDLRVACCAVSVRRSRCRPCRRLHLQNRVPPPCRNSRVSLPCNCHSRSNRLLTPPSLAFLEPIENPSYLHISRQFGRKLEFSFRLRVAQS